MVRRKGIIYKTEHFSKIFGDRYILNDINLKINQGEIFGIIGTSGSGKSTLLHSLVGFLKSDKGDIKFRNVNMLNTKDAESFRSIYKHQKELKRLYGFAAQTPSFYPNLSVLENLCYFGTLYNLSKEAIRSNIEYLLNLVGLTQSQHVLAKELSGGMQRRLDIACSLIHDPKILLLDEPTADLDPVLSSKIWNLLRIINQRGTTIILASHHIIELDRLCDRVAIIKDGMIRAIGKPEEIKSKNLPRESVHIRSSPGDYKRIISKLKRSCSKIIKDYEIKNKFLVVHAHRTGEIAPQVLKIIDELEEKVISIESIKPKLDQAFILINEELLVEDKKTNKKIKRRSKKKVTIKKKKKKLKEATKVKSEKKDNEKELTKDQIEMIEEKINESKKRFER